VILPTLWTQHLTLGDYLTDSPWSLPVVAFHQSQTKLWAEWCKEQKNLKCLSFHGDFGSLPSPLDFHYSRLGYNNAPRWDGTHLGKSIFGLSSVAGLF
jgi:hypothetical protein